MAQKFLTKEVEKRMSKYPLYSQDGKGAEAICTAKFFYPANSWTWYVTEWDGEDTCFGVVINGYGEGEYGYFSLKELQSVRGRFGLQVERDMYFDPQPLKHIEDVNLQEFICNINVSVEVL